ncbi:MAG: hypothetical protein ACI9H8_001018 [Lysobacterales bacterium]|jgi:hypothetical protein
MSWLENNPLGVALISFCGLTLLIAGVLVYVWSKPASSGVLAADMTTPQSGQADQMISDLGPIASYREVTERPVFDESRRPSLKVDVEGDGLGDLAEIAGAPEVRLTGVIITPKEKLAMLRPISGGESLVAREGESLEGEFVGWEVSEIKPRSVVLESRDGDNLELDLLVNTRKIEEPLKLEPVVAANNAGSQGKPEQGGKAQNSEAAASGDQATDSQPLSRAEEIRERIAERREQLRRQAEEGDGDLGSSNRTRNSSGSGQSAYQSAIQDMINRNSQKDKEDKDNGDGGDG